MQKVLIVTYYWPPSAGAGVQRWLKFAKYLPEHGWQPVIFTPENPDFNLTDPSLGQDLPPEVEVLRFPIWEPYALFRKLSGGQGKDLKQGQVLERSGSSLGAKAAAFLRGNLLVPDPRVFWVKPAAKFIEEIWQENNFKAIVTTGPPHSMHLVGRHVRRKLGVPWLADFRDPWSHWDLLKKFHIMRPIMDLHRRMERSVLQEASLTLTVSRNWQKDFEALGARRTAVIPNGFDPADFGLTIGEAGAEANAEPHPDAAPEVLHRKGGPDCFRVSHLGMISQYRNPEALWQALSELCAENKDFADALELHLAGILSEVIVNRLQADPHLGPRLRTQRYLPHNEVVQAYQNAALLLLILNRSTNAPGHIPGKLFEYLAARRPILALGPANGDSAGIIKVARAGQVVNPADKAAIKQAVLQAFERFKQGHIRTAGNIDAYSRPQQAAQLAQLLNQL